MYRYSGIVTIKDDSGSGGNQIVYYLHFASAVDLLPLPIFPCIVSGFH